jgi:hypothetical protein
LPRANPSTGLDPVILARFLVMPGVEPLLDAFGRIPPGPMRDSVIHLARTLADQYSAAPAGMGMPDPLLTAAGFIVTPPPVKEATRLAGPRADAPAPPKAKPKDTLPENLVGPEADVIRLRKKGRHPVQIADETGLARHAVQRIIANAKAAGIQFPNLHYTHKGPIEQKRWYTHTDQLSTMGLVAVTRAAAKVKLSAQGYLDCKMRVLDMAQKGAQVGDIAEATPFTVAQVGVILSHARAAGINVPYSGLTKSFLSEARKAEQEGRPAPLPTVAAGIRREVREKVLAPPSSATEAGSNVIWPSRFFGPFSAVGPRQAPMVARAAARRNMTPDAYLDLQENVVRLRMEGMNPRSIAARVGADMVFIKDAIQAAKDKGAVYPPCPKGWSVARATG